MKPNENYTPPEGSGIIIYAFEWFHFSLPFFASKVFPFGKVIIKSFFVNNVRHRDTIRIPQEAGEGGT